MRLLPQIIPLLLACALTAPATAQTGCTTEDFESYFVTAGNSSALSPAGTPLDENTFWLGQGPGLVADGCVYSPDPGGFLTWYGDGYFGLSTRTLTAAYNPGYTYRLLRGELRPSDRPRRYRIVD